jgi:hypothetical protein
VTREVAAEEEAAEEVVPKAVVEAIPCVLLFWSNPPAAFQPSPLRAQTRENEFKKGRGECHDLICPLISLFKNLETAGGLGENGRSVR